MYNINALLINKKGCDELINADELKQAVSELKAKLTEAGDAL